jgi:hypothetical protein
VLNPRTLIVRVPLLFDAFIVERPGLEAARWKNKMRHAEEEP